jgi:hypothetical protein
MILFPLPRRWLGFADFTLPHIGSWILLSNYPNTEKGSRLSLTFMKATCWTDAGGISRGRLSVVSCQRLVKLKARKFGGASAPFWIATQLLSKMYHDNFKCEPSRSIPCYHVERSVHVPAQKLNISNERTRESMLKILTPALDTSFMCSSARI